MMKESKSFDVVALGELLVDFTQNGLSEQGNLLFEANPGGAPANVLAMLRKLGKRCAFVGKVGKDSFGDMLEKTVREAGIDTSKLDNDAIAEQISNADAVAIVNELKLILDETQNMTDEELREQIIRIAGEYGYTLTDDMITRLISLCRSLEGLSIAELTDKVEQFKSGIETVQKYADTVQEYAEKATSFGQKVGNFFKAVGDFFGRLFGGK